MEVQETDKLPFHCLCKRICRLSRCSCVKNGTTCSEACPCSCVPKQKGIACETNSVTDVNTTKRKPEKSKAPPKKKQKISHPETNDESNCKNSLHSQESTPSSLETEQNPNTMEIQNNPQTNELTAETVVINQEHDDTQRDQEVNQTDKDTQCTNPRKCSKACLCLGAKQVEPNQETKSSLTTKRKRGRPKKKLPPQKEKPTCSQSANASTDQETKCRKQNPSYDASQESKTTPNPDTIQESQRNQSNQIHSDREQQEHRDHNTPTDSVCTSENTSLSSLCSVKEQNRSETNEEMINDPNASTTTSKTPKQKHNKLSEANTTTANHQFEEQSSHEAEIKSSTESEAFVNPTAIETETTLHIKSLSVETTREENNEMKNDTNNECKDFEEPIFLTSQEGNDIAQLCANSENTTHPEPTNTPNQETIREKQTSSETESSPGPTKEPEQYTVLMKPENNSQAENFAIGVTNESNDMEIDITELMIDEKNELVCTDSCPSVLGQKENEMEMDEKNHSVVLVTTKRKRGRPKKKRPPKKKQKVLHHENGGVFNTQPSECEKQTAEKMEITLSPPSTLKQCASPTGIENKAQNESNRCEDNELVQEKLVQPELDVSHDEILMELSADEESEDISACITVLQTDSDINPKELSSKQEAIESEQNQQITSIIAESEIRTEKEDSSLNHEQSNEERKERKKKCVSFDENAKVRLFKRTVSLCTVPSTGSYPLGLGWEIKGELDTPLLLESVEPSAVLQVPETIRMVRLVGAGVSISQQFDRSQRTSRRGRSMEVQPELLETTEDDDQRIPLDHIRNSRNGIGCHCAPKKSKKKKKENKGSKKKQKQSCCSGNSCECAKNGLRCHIGICFCAEYECKNPKGRRQLAVDQVQLARLRVLQPEVYNEIQNSINNTAEIDSTVSEPKTAPVLSMIGESTVEVDEELYNKPAPNVRTEFDKWLYWTKNRWRFAKLKRQQKEERDVFIK